MASKKWSKSLVCSKRKIPFSNSEESSSDEEDERKRHKRDISSDEDDDDNEASTQSEDDESSSYKKGRKRKKMSSLSPRGKKSPGKRNSKSIRLDEVPEEVLNIIATGVDQLDQKAEKTQLTATLVKDIIKNVMTDENVLAMVKNTILNTEQIPAVFEPKLTRAKTKELLEKQRTEHGVDVETSANYWSAGQPKEKSGIF